MPNARAAAAATGLPESGPQHQAGGTARLPSRRLVAAGVVIGASALAAPAAPAAPAALASHAGSALDELLQDYRWADEAADAAVEAHAQLEATVELPEVRVCFGRRRITDPTTGDITWQPWEFTSRAEIERYFRPVIEAWASDRFVPHDIEGLRAHRDALFEVIDAQLARRADTARASGLVAADEAADRAVDERIRIRDAIFAYAPTTMAEVAAKNRFLRELMDDGFELTAEELRSIFSSAQPIA